MTKQELKAKIDKLENGIKSKATPSNLIAPLKAQKAKFEKELEDMESAEKKAVKTKKVSKVAEKIKAAKTSVAKKTPAKAPAKEERKKDNIARDGDRKSLPSGKRISKTGKVYYETRANRSDKQTSKKPYLAEGGETDGWKKNRTRKLKTREEAEKAIVKFSELMGRAGRNYKVEKMDDGYVISYESNYEPKMADGGKINIGTIKDNIVYFDKQSGAFFLRVIDGLGNRVNKINVNTIDDLFNDYPTFRLNEIGKIEFKDIMADGGKISDYEELQSVNSIIDKKTLIIYKKSDKNKQKGISIDDVSDSWFSKLSDYDFGTVDELINKRNSYKKGGEVSKKYVVFFTRLNNGKTVPRIVEMYDNETDAKEYVENQKKLGEKGFKIKQAKDMPIYSMINIVDKSKNKELKDLIHSKDKVDAFFEGKDSFYKKDYGWVKPYGYVWENWKLVSAPTETMAKGGDVYDDMNDEIEFANNKAKKIANSLESLGYKVIKVQEADYDTDAQIDLSEKVNVQVGLEGDLSIVIEKEEGKFTYIDCGKSYATLLQKLPNIDKQYMEKGGKTKRTVKLTLSDKDSYDYTYKQDGATASITFGFGKEPFQYEVKKISKSLEPLQQDILDTFTLQGIKQHDYKGGFSEAIKHLDTSILENMDEFAKGGYNYKPSANLKEDEYQKLYKRLKERKEKGENLDSREEYAFSKAEYILKTRGLLGKEDKMADGGSLDKDIADKIDQDLKLIDIKKEKYQKELNQLKSENSKDRDTITYLEYELENLEKLQDKLMKVKNSKMADGGEIDWGADLGGGFSVGNDVYITDSKSLFQGKTGFVSGSVGRDLLVTLMDNGNERSVVVSKKGVERLDAPEYAKGGELKKAQLLIIDPSNPLSTQLKKLTGDFLNSADFKDIGSGNFNILTHKHSNKIFIVYPKRIYDSLPEQEKQDDISYLKNVEKIKLDTRSMADGGYVIFEGRDHYNDKPLYKVISKDEDNDYDGEFHDNREDAEKELKELKNKDMNYAKGGNTDKLYTKLVEEHSKGGYERMGVGFDRFLKMKMESASAKGNMDMYYKLMDVEQMYENDFYAKGGYMADGGELKSQNGKNYKEEFEGSNRWLEVDDEYSMTKSEHESEAFRANSRGDYELRDKHREISQKLSEEPIKMADGGEVKRVTDGDDTYYLTYIDSTHFYLSNSKDYKGNAFHIAEFRSRPFYDEVKSWLKSHKGEMMAKGGEVPAHFGSGKNINVFGYQTENFDICGTAVKEFESAMEIMQNGKESEKESLARCAKYVDGLFGIEKLVVETAGADDANFYEAVSDIMSASIYNYRAEMSINLFSFVPQHLKEIAVRMEKAEKGGFYALGGMTAGRWYKDASGEEFKFIGKVDSGANKGRFLFSDGQKSVYKDLEEFEGGKPKETKLFGFFAEGGMVEHGLKIGDKIVSDLFWDNTLVVDNFKTGKAVVNLETGKRIEGGKMEKGGYMADGGEVDVKDLTIPKYEATKPNFQEGQSIGKFKMPSTWEVGGFRFNDEKEANSFYDKLKGIDNMSDYLEIKIKKEQDIFPVKYQPSAYKESKVGSPFHFSSFQKAKKKQHFVFTEMRGGEQYTIDFIFDRLVEDRALGWLKIDGEWEYGNFIFDSEGYASIGSGSNKLTLVKTMEKGGYMAKGGDLNSIKEQYLQNEDENAHSENVVLLAKHFGTKEDLAKAKEILALHEREGSLSSENGKKRQELHLKLIGKARAEMGKQGIEFEKGGYMADGGELDTFEKKVKDAMKQTNKWHFITENVDGKDVQLKMFVGTKEVDVQIFKINGIHARMPRNYSGKRDTLKMIMDNFESKMAMGGKVKFADKVKSVQESLLKRKKVAPQVQKDYGKTYSKAEAKESAQRIVGSRMAQLKEKMAKKKK